MEIQAKGPQSLPLFHHRKVMFSTFLQPSTPTTFLFQIKELLTSVLPPHHQQMKTFMLFNEHHWDHLLIFLMICCRHWTSIPSSLLHRMLPEALVSRAGWSGGNRAWDWIWQESPQAAQRGLKAVLAPEHWFVFVPLSPWPRDHALLCHPAPWIRALGTQKWSPRGNKKIT